MDFNLESKYEQSKQKSTTINSEMQYIKNMYKKYINHIANMEFHINRLCNDYIIDTNTKNKLLHRLNLLIQQTTKIHDDNIEEYNSISPQENFHFSIALIDQIDIFDIINGKNTINDPFYKINKDLCIIAEEYGTLTIHDFLRMYINDCYIDVLDKNDKDIIELYNKIFVPIKISIDNITRKNKFMVNAINSKYDGLIDNVCLISFDIRQIGNYRGVTIEMEGYVYTDDLGIYVTPEIKQMKCKLLQKNKIDPLFYSKYIKSLNPNIYFTNNVTDLSAKMIIDYDFYNVITAKNQNTIIKNFSQGNLKEMFNIIRILLIDEQNIGTATLLFELLKDKKIDGIIVSNIIYKNLSYTSKLKLVVGSNELNTELKKIKTLVVENITIEKRLCSMTNMPDNVKSYILEKNNEIKSGENNYKIQTAINGLMQFPWKKPININDSNKSLYKSRNYLMNIAKKLNENIYGHDKSKQVLIELFGKWMLNPNSTGQVIGLFGPPGVGKTLFAKSLSESLDIPLTTIGLGGMSDASDLVGHNFTYSGAQYGMIVRQMIKAGKWRSVMFFDEVDKVSKRNDTNEIYNTLIHITDPIMNQHFQDRFYSTSIDFDLSGQLIIFSYNSPEKLDPILRDRIHEIEIPAYTTKDKILIAQNYIINDLCKNVELPRSQIIISDMLLKYIIENYTNEAGIRELKRKLEQILLKINIDRLYMKGPFKKLLHNKYLNGHKAHINTELQREYNSINADKNDIATYSSYSESKIEKLLTKDVIDSIFNLENDNKIILDMHLLHKYLDKPMQSNELIHHARDSVGIVNGLYATNIGIGGIIPIQIYKNHIQKSNSSSTKLKITGNQKLVMKESVVCALTVAINLVSEPFRKKINTDFANGFHIHAPDGGTPKDGPSAGCAFTTAFVSILLGKKINKYVSMTGEIDLTGKISKIGGLNAKLSGAKKAGIKTVFIPYENKTDYENIMNTSPELFDTNDFAVILVKNIYEIISNLLVIPDINIIEDLNRI